MRLSEASSGDPDLPVYRVDNGTLSLAFLPTVGGRLISITSSGRELLWRNPAYLDSALMAVRARVDWPIEDGTFASWVNIGGSKTWPAPQGWNGEGEWAGPPDSVLDSGTWSIASRESGRALVVTLTSGDDARSGIRIEREFTVPESGHTFSQRTTFTNMSDRPVTWSIWEVCQVDTSSGAGLPSSEAGVEVDAADERIVDLGSYHGELHADASGGVIRFAIQDAVAKRGFPSATGRISFRGPQGGLELGFTPVEDAHYPDQGSRAEIWMQAPIDHAIEELSGLHPDATLVELEVLAPLVEIEPGESYTAAVSWRVLP